MTSEDRKNACYFKLAKMTNEQKWCDAIDKENPEKSGTQLKDRCISYIAEVYSDASRCEEISSKDTLYWKCRALASLNIEECLDNDTDCIISIVKKTHVYEDCLQLTDDKNDCLRYAGCNKPEKRKEICSYFEYDQWTFPEEKELCLTETWECPDVPRRMVH